MRFAPCRLARSSLAPSRSAFSRFASCRSAPARYASRRLAFLSAALRSTALSRFAPSRSARESARAGERAPSTGRRPADPRVRASRLVAASAAPDPVSARPWSSFLPQGAACAPDSIRSRFDLVVVGRRRLVRPALGAAAASRAHQAPPAPRAAAGTAASGQAEREVDLAEARQRDRHLREVDVALAARSASWPRGRPRTSRAPRPRTPGAPAELADQRAQLWRRRAAVQRRQRGRRGPPERLHALDGRRRDLRRDARHRRDLVGLRRVERLEAPEARRRSSGRS